MKITTKHYKNTNGSVPVVDAYRTIKDAIQYLDMEPGSFIVEAELVREFGVGRTPIREALIRLSDERLVERFPQRGTYVSKIDLALVRDIAYLRHIVETDILLELCRKEVDLRRNVANILLLQKHAVEDNNPVEYVQGNDLFHAILFEYAGHSLLWEIIHNSLVHYVRYLMLDVSRPETLKKSYEEHLEMIEHIRLGNSGDLRKLLVMHHDFLTIRSESTIMIRYPLYFK